MVPRRIIIKGKSYLHAVFRCHNRDMLLSSYSIKRQLILLWAKYRVKYGVKVIEFIIMDNHAHLILQTPDCDAVSNFMRTCNSQLAKMINAEYGRDSQAIKERFKSPVIFGKKYFYRVIKYIWMNRVKVDQRHDALTDPFNSASWRLGGKVPHFGFEKKDQALIEHMLADYSSFDLPLPKDVPQLLRSLYQSALNEIKDILLYNFDIGHTIADQATVDYRTELISSFGRDTGPPGYTCMKNKSGPASAK
jgi:REP element-mobilizing transposase RayT